MGKEGSFGWSYSRKLLRSTTVFSQVSFREKWETLLELWKYPRFSIIYIQKKCISSCSKHYLIACQILRSIWIYLHMTKFWDKQMGDYFFVRHFEFCIAEHNPISVPKTNLNESHFSTEVTSKEPPIYALNAETMLTQSGISWVSASRWW